MESKEIIEKTIRELNEEVELHKEEINHIRNKVRKLKRILKAIQ